VQKAGTTVSSPQHSQAKKSRITTPSGAAKCKQEECLSPAQAGKGREARGGSRKVAGGREPLGGRQHQACNTEEERRMGASQRPRTLKGMDYKLTIEVRLYQDGFVEVFRQGWGEQGGLVYSQC